jgi:hypothetical protein
MSGCINKYIEEDCYNLKDSGKKNRYVKFRLETKFTAGLLE